MMLIPSGPRRLQDSMQILRPRRDYSPNKIIQPEARMIRMQTEVRVKELKTPRIPRNLLSPP
jgi:hypothetical protein